MIALDTNVLLRLFTQDGARQEAAASRAVKDLPQSGGGYVSTIVLCELLWTLRSTYGAKSAELGNAVRAMLSAEELVVEHHDAVGRALAHSGVDLTDAIVHEVGQAGGCTRTLTFDRRFARLEGVDLLDA